MATFGVCGVLLLAGFAVAGGLGAAVTYDLQTGPKSTQGELQAIGLGAAGGLVGGAAGPIVGKIAGAIGSKIASAVGSGTAAETAASFGTESGQAVFWSGLGRDGASQAANYAAKTGGMTLEQAAGAAGLPAYDTANAASIAAWRNASESFARGASGNVRVVLGTSRAESIWNTVELPALKANPSVESITAINPATGESKLIWGR